MQINKRRVNKAPRTKEFLEMYGEINEFVKNMHLTVEGVETKIAIIQKELHQENITIEQREKKEQIIEQLKNIEQNVKVQLSEKLHHYQNAISVFEEKFKSTKVFFTMRHDVELLCFLKAINDFYLVDDRQTKKDSYRAAVKSLLKLLDVAQEYENKLKNKQITEVSGIAPITLDVLDQMLKKTTFCVQMLLKDASIAYVFDYKLLETKKINFSKIIDRLDVKSKLNLFETLYNKYTLVIENKMKAADPNAIESLHYFTELLFKTYLANGQKKKLDENKIIELAKVLNLDGQVLYGTTYFIGYIIYKKIDPETAKDYLRLSVQYKYNTAYLLYGRILLNNATNLNEAEEYLQAFIPEQVDDHIYLYQTYQILARLTNNPKHVQLAIGQLYLLLEQKQNDEEIKARLVCAQYYFSRCGIYEIPNKEDFYQLLESLYASKKTSIEIKTAKSIFIDLLKRGEIHTTSHYSLESIEEYPSDEKDYDCFDYFNLTSKAHQMLCLQRESISISQIERWSEYFFKAQSGLIKQASPEPYISMKLINNFFEVLFLGYKLSLPKERCVEILALIQRKAQNLIKTLNEEEAGNVLYLQQFLLIVKEFSADYLIRYFESMKGYFGWNNDVLNDTISCLNKFSHSSQLFQNRIIEVSSNQSRLFSKKANTGNDNLLCNYKKDSSFLEKLVDLCSLLKSTPRKFELIGDNIKNINKILNDICNVQLMTIDSLIELGDCLVVLQFDPDRDEAGIDITNHWLKCFEKNVLKGSINTINSLDARDIFDLMKIFTKIPLQNEQIETCLSYLKAYNPAPWHSVSQVYRLFSIARLCMQFDVDKREEYRVLIDDILKQLLKQKSLAEKSIAVLDHAACILKVCFKQEPGYLQQIVDAFNLQKKSSQESSACPSYTEQEIAELIRHNYPHLKTNYLIGPYEVDIFIPATEECPVNYFIEIDGPTHFYFPTEEGKLLKYKSVPPC